MKPFFASAIVTVLLVPACGEQPSSPQDALATSTSAASSATTSMTFRRGSGALDVGREVCDERRDPRLQNVTAVIMEGLRPADVTAQLTPSATDGPSLTIRVNGTSDVLATQFFVTNGEDCWSGVREIDWLGGAVWRSVADVASAGSSCASTCGERAKSGCWCDDKCASHGDCCADKTTVCAAPKLLAGSCAGACGGPGSGRCYCDDRCVAQGDCCADRAPLCASSGFVGTERADDLVFDRTPAQPHFRGEDWGGHTIRYNYRRLVDSHPECVEHTRDGGSLLRIVMRSQLGTAPAVEQIVSGFDTSATPIAFHGDIALTSRGVDLNLRFRCGRGRNHDDAFDDNNGRGYSVYIPR